MKKSIDYITHARYCQAKNEAGNNPLFKVYPPETHKLFPFYIHTNFHIPYFRYKQNRQVKIKPLYCGRCKCDMSPDGNGEYYTGYIIFDSSEKFYPCCYTCKKKISGLMSYHDQESGFRNGIELPEIFNESLPHKVVYKYIIEGHKYHFVQFRNGINFNQLKTFSDRLNSSSWWGGAGDLCAYVWGSSKLSIAKSVNSKKPLHQFTRSQVIEIINEILNANNLKPEIQQLKLF